MHSKEHCEETSAIIKDYYKGILFLFLPNICNARCYFCYLQPALSESAKIGPNTIDKLKHFVRIAWKLGFEEIRITGGEPLVFENLKEVIDIIKDNRMRYTLLTNGINLVRYLDCICSTLPLKVTISFHSFNNVQSIYGVDYNPDWIVSSIKKMLFFHINVTIALLFLPENERDVINIIDRFAAFGVRHFKLIYPNCNDIGMRMYNKFRNTVSTLMNYRNNGIVEIRYTKLDQECCLLEDRGFLSLTIPDFKLYSCCALAHERTCHSIAGHNIEEISSCLMSIYVNSRNIKGYPCNSYISTCPISLNTEYKIRNSLLV